MTVYRIYSRSDYPDAQWQPLCLGHYSHVVREWTDKTECKREFDELVREEKRIREEMSKPQTGIWVMPWGPRQYKIVAIPTVDVEVFDAPYSPPEQRAPAAKPDQRRAARVDATPAWSAQPDPRAAAPSRTAPCG